MSESIEASRRLTNVDQEVLDYGREQIKAIMREVVKEVDPRPFLREMTARQFDLVRMTAYYDRWGEYTDEQLCEKLKTDPQRLHEIKTSPAFHQMQTALSEAFDRVATPRRLEEWIKDPRLQDMIARRTVDLALYEPDGRVSVKALEQLNERIMSTKQRDTTPVRVLVIRGDISAVLNDAWVERPPKEIGPARDGDEP